MENILQGIDISKNFIDARGSIEAIKNVSFTLSRGEFLGIVGESGCGKSTLLRIVAGLIKPDSGQLLHNGNSYLGETPAATGRFLQMIFQDAYTSFDPRMKMKKSIVEAASSNVDENQIRPLLDTLGLTPALLEKRPSELSGGQCQRMSIMRAILSGADILLCDEITSALDVVTEAQIVELLKNECENRALSMMFVSHDIALVSKLCDTIIVMHDGEIVEQGPTDKVIESPEHEYTKRLIASCKSQSL